MFLFINEILMFQVGGCGFIQVGMHVASASAANKLALQPTQDSGMTGTIKHHHAGSTSHAAL
jgi:hypothetical protein